MSGGAPIRGRILFLHVFKKSRYQGFRGVHGKENALPFTYRMEVSLVAGRLFGMQGSIFRQQIQRRLEEIRGASSTIGRNLEYALWILCDLDLLRIGDAKGEYLKCDPLPIVNRLVAVALWKAILLATKGGAVSISRLRTFPAFFAFSMPDLTEGDFVKFFPDVEFSGGIGLDDILTTV